MPYRLLRPCAAAGCIGHATAHGYCEAHQGWYTPPERSVDDRPSSSRRGYDSSWAALRRRVLREWGIPKEEWPLWDVDHEPCFDPDIEPDHSAYKLPPRKHGEHSSKTNTDRRAGKTRIWR
jgi:hypothetical protein